MFGLEILYVNLITHCLIINALLYKTFIFNMFYGTLYLEDVESDLDENSLSKGPNERE